RRRRPAAPQRGTRRARPRDRGVAGEPTGGRDPARRRRTERGGGLQHFVDQRVQSESAPASRAIALAGRVGTADESERVMIGMSCQRATELETEAREGTLTGLDLVRRRIHLALCPYCQRYEAQIARTIDAVEGLEAPPASEETRRAALEAFRARKITK